MGEWKLRTNPFPMSDGWFLNLFDEIREPHRAGGWNSLARQLLTVYSGAPLHCPVKLEPVVPVRTQTWSFVINQNSASPFPLRSQ